MTSSRLDDFLSIMGTSVKSIHISTRVWLSDSECTAKKQEVDREQAVQEMGDIVGLVSREYLDDDVCVDKWHASVEDKYSYLVDRTFMGIPLLSVEVRCSATVQNEPEAKNTDDAPNLNDEDEDEDEEDDDKEAKGLIDAYDRMMSAYEEFKNIVMNRNRFLYERWKAGGYLIDQNVISHYPNAECVLDECV